MIIKNFIRDLSQEMRDPNMLVTTSTDWLAIINREGQDLFPDIVIKKTATIAYSSLTSSTHELDMSTSTYTGIKAVEKVYIKDSNGKRYFYDNWIYDENTKVLLLQPTSEVTPTYVLSSSYPNIEVIYQCSWVDTAGNISVTGTSTVNIEQEHESLFRKICIKAAISSMMRDSLKLDRYRTLVGRSNVYEMLAINRDLMAEIELKRSKITNTNKVRTL